MHARTKILSLTVALVLLPAVNARAQVAWEPTLEAALSKAKAEGRPLLISMHTSTEIACQRMLKTLYTDPAVAPILSEFVLLPTCFDQHDEVVKTVDGKEISVSPLFGTLGCDQLRKNEADVRKTFFDKSEIKVPQHIFVGDDGKPYLKKIYELKKPAFITLLNNALIIYGSDAADGMDKVTKGFLKTVKTGHLKNKRKAVKGLLDLEDPRKVDVLYLTIQSIHRERDKGECIRAFGKDTYAWASDTVAKWLRDPSEHVRNCAVVSLEELGATGVTEQLLALFEKARDKEFRKDILRALGPCSEDSDTVKSLLIKNVKARREVDRIACYLSLGYFLDDEAVQALLAKQFKKEGRSGPAKTAIIWAHTYLRDQGLIKPMHALVANEKNHQLKYMANAAELKIRTGTGVARKDGRGGYVKLHKALGAIFGNDKILRNSYKYWKGDN
ncbi:MAG: thioredoxin family protein [Planctomycetota bacterium]|nr:thioredoxin family protein [Planctomycetota bacterium]